MDNQKDIDSISEERQLWRLFGVAYIAMLNAKKRVLEPAGVGFSRGWALWALNAMGRPATITEMAQILDRDRRATAQLLKRMADDGLVERRQGASNGNAITVSLTAEGQAVVERIIATDEASGEIMACLTREEQQMLAQCLHKLHREALTRIALHTHSFPDTYAAKLGLSQDEA